MLSKLWGIAIFIVIILVFELPNGFAGDMRQEHRDFETQRKQMTLQAEQELDRARTEARKKAAKIKTDKGRLKAAIADLRAGNAALKKENTGFAKKIDTLKAANDTLRESLTESRAVNKEMAGFVTTYAKDLQSLIVQSLQSALTQNRQGFLAPLISRERFWSMADIRQMTDLLFAEVRASGEVKVTQGPIIDRKGRDRIARILTVGNFTGSYVLETESGGIDETGFLLYSDQSQRFFALSRLPSARLEDNLTAYLAGQSDSVPVDVSRGGALRQLTHELNLAEQVPKGGPIVWPILTILGISLLILLERLVFFLRRRIQVEPFMAGIKTFLGKEDWEGCERFMAKRKKSLIPKVLLAALAFRDQSRQDMENALQEAILGEIPAVERFLSTLGMLAAIAPLMGLLGTVTGMINTFHVITYYGAGDPRMMAGGISEALVTTMLGLAVAIPIMLCHTLLSRQVETQINRMEEKAVAFVNLVFKARNQCRSGNL